MKLSKTILFIVLLFYVSGCNSGTVKISGRATFQGQPIEKGKISFDSTDGSVQGVSGEILNGDFDLTLKQVNEKVPMVVRVWGFKNTGKKVKAPAGAPGITQENELLDEIQMYIPAEHNNSSKKIVEIEPGKNNVFDIELKSAIKGRLK